MGRRRRRLVMRCVSRARALRPQSVRPHPRHWWGSSYSRAAPRSGTRGHPSGPLRRLKRKLLLLTLLLPGPTPRTCRWRGRCWPRTVRTGRAWTTALRRTTTAWSRPPHARRRPVDGVGSCKGGCSLGSIWRPVQTRPPQRPSGVRVQTSRGGSAGGPICCAWDRQCGSCKRNGTYPPQPTTRIAGHGCRIRVVITVLGMRERRYHR